MLKHVFGERFSGFWSSSPKIGKFWPQISAIFPPADWQNCKRQAKYVVTLSNQTYLPIITRFGVQRHVFGELFSGFWSSSPKIGDFWPHISAILPPAASQNTKKLAKYVVTLSNQICLPMTTRFGGQRHVFGELFSGFWSSSPKIGDFWPHISATLLLAASQNCKRLAKYVVTLSNQTYLPMITRFGGSKTRFWRAVQWFLELQF